MDKTIISVSVFCIPRNRYPYKKLVNIIKEKVYKQFHCNNSFGMKSKYLSL